MELSGGRRRMMHDAEGRRGEAERQRDEADSRLVVDHVR